MKIQWYPGHMTKAKRMMVENVSLVDVVIELLDARVPYSSKNPDIDTIAKNKHRIVVLNKADLADDKVTAKWKAYYEKKGFNVILTNSVKGKGINDIVAVSRELMKEKFERQRAKGRIFIPIRSMIVGIPNVGKSTLINKCCGKAATKTGDRPGVTKSKQWVRLKKDFELLDTPGVLWPKFEDDRVGVNLAITGAIRDQILDIGELALELIKILLPNKEVLEQRYKIEINTEDPVEIMELIGFKRGFKSKGNVIDYDRVAIILLDEFRGGKLGRISLESPSEQ